MLHAHRSIRTALLGLALACAGSTWAAESGVIGQGSFRPPNTPMTLPAHSPFSVEDLSSGRVSFAIRWDDGAPDGDPNPHRGVYPGAIKEFKVRIGATEIALPADGAVFEVSDGSDVSHREFIRVQASQVVGAHTLTVGWITLNEITRAGDLRGASGRLAGDALPNSERLVAFQPTGRFDRNFFVTLSANAEPRSFPVYLQTSDIELKATPVTPGAAR